MGKSGVVKCGTNSISDRADEKMLTYLQMWDCIIRDSLDIDASELAASCNSTYFQGALVSSI